MFIVWCGSLLTTLLAAGMFSGFISGNGGFTLTVALWLWFTVLFANFAEALAEGRSKAQADSLKGMKTSRARRLHAAQRDSGFDMVSADTLRKGIWYWWKQGSDPV